MSKHMIAGSGGLGGGQRTVQQPTYSSAAPVTYSPTTTPDTLNSTQWATILDLIGEGEIEGFPSAKGFSRTSSEYGLAMLKDIYLDNTPVLRPQANIGSLQASDYNFTGVTVTPRYGTQAQDYIPGAEATSSEILVNAKVKYDVPITRYITDTNVDAVRVTISIPQMQIFQPTGDIGGSAIRVIIELSYGGGPFESPGGDGPQNQLIVGRTADLYQQSTVVNFPAGSAYPIGVRVKRYNPDTNASNHINEFYWASYAEIIYSKLRYPNSTLMQLRINAEQFSSVPQRSYRVRGLKIKIPSNATVDTTTGREGRLLFSGVWDGQFGSAVWCNDPAWCLWDLLTNQRYGFGNHINAAALDKWAFYRASVYCSELVSDGLGGQEPRFTCNVNIQTQDDAYKLINDMASIFRAMPYWTAGSLTIAQDRPTDESYIFNHSNVTPEGFSYSGSSIKARPTVVVSKYFDLNTQDIAYETVEDRAAIARYGVVKAEVEAFACTSKGQAHRIADWLLYSNQYESEVVTFTCSIEAGVVVRPGQIIRINDPVRAGERTGGRIISATTTQITVDSVADITFTNDDYLSIVQPDGTFGNPRQITSRNGNVLTVAAPFQQAPQKGAVWFVGTSIIRRTLWRVLSVTEKDRAQYTVTALSYNESKFDYVERGNTLVRPSTSSLFNPAAATSLSSGPAAPQNLSATEVLYEAQGQVFSKIILGWSVVKGSSQYQVRWRYESGNWVDISTRSNDYEILNTSVGTYEIEVYGQNALLVAGAKAAIILAAAGKSAPPNTIPSLNIAPIDEKSAELYWPQSVDIDVRVGGQIRIRHTPDTTGTASWGRANDIVPAVNGASTRKIVPLLEGTYFIRAVDSVNNESPDVASAVVKLPAPQDSLLIQNYQEHTGNFPGSSTNMVYSVDEAGLVLVATTNVDSMATDGNWDNLIQIDYVGGTASSGEYTFQNTLDLGAVYDVDIQAALLSRPFTPGSLIDVKTDFVDDWTDWDAENLSDVNASLFVRNTQTDPGGSPTWSTWQPFVNGTSRGRGFQFKMTVTCTNVSQSIVVEQLGAKITFQRRTETQRNLTSGTSLYTITYPTAFYDVPSLGITAQSLGAGGYFTISSATRSGFQIRFYDGSGNAVSKTFDYQAVGHGREIP
jgi:predicted phage tail protein